ncbi:hypothetical protein G5I_14635 [Acromyrmex echinatior]|uniref:Uncharacterized protein n=1 Tax=Acromyrmex echinatior TaxID=103372 RepID=F4X891_ACREC|nr:hypothetical protein G5I_14635 [Acromyrmex echinatior]
MTADCDATPEHQQSYDEIIDHYREKEKRGSRKKGERCRQAQLIQQSPLVSGTILYVCAHSTSMHNELSKVRQDKV